MPLTPTAPDSEARPFSVLHFIGQLIFGLIVGAIAKLFVPGHDPGGIIATMLLGMAGAALGGFIGRSMGWYAPGHPAGFLMAVVGAIVLLVIYHLAFGGRGRTADLGLPQAPAIVWQVEANPV